MRYIVTIICALHSLSLFAGGYKIDVTIKGASDSAVYLAVHYGGEKFVKDTAVFDKKGHAVFKGDSALPGGMYLLASGGEHILDFLISDEHQTFSFSATKGDYTGTLHFKDSPENEVFADFTRFMKNKRDKETELNEMARKAKKDQEIQKYVETEKQAYQNMFLKEVEKIKRDFPSGLLYSVASAMNTPTPEKLNLPENTPGRDSILYRYYYDFEINHFWDNFVLTDVRMQYTPILIPAVDGYFTNILVPRPDSIIRYMDKFLARAAPSPEMSKFFAGHLFNLFFQSEIMGMENVAMHLIDNYYLNGKVAGDDKFLHDIKDYADKYRATMIGKLAANLKMETLGGQYETLYDIDAPYILVYFFEPGCGHCQKETPKVYEVYEKYKDKGLTGYCVYTQQKKSEWMAYIAKNNMQWINVWDPENNNDFRKKYSVYIVPQVYLLDKNKVIIGRRLSAEMLDKMLGNLLKTPERK